MDDFCEIVLILDLWFSRFHIKLFLIKSSANPFFGDKNHLCHSLVEGIMRNISVKIFLI